MATLKELKRLLKKAGMKSTGSKRALTRRAKKAHLMRGGEDPVPPKTQDVQSATFTQESDARAAEDRARAEAAAARGERARPGGSRGAKPKRGTHKRRSVRYITASAYRY